jgi:acetyl esterase/lipase
MLHSTRAVMTTVSFLALALTPALAQDAASPAEQPAEATESPVGASEPMASEAEPPQANAQMQEVLDTLKELEAKPLHTLDVPEARFQASPADAARTVQRDQMIPPGPEGEVETTDIAIPSPNGNLPARIYTPSGEGPFPVIVYYHGGGWVVADLNTYDATPRALAVGSDAIVVSIEYRHAPEHKFPAAHEDAWTGYAWAVEHAESFGGDSTRVAVAGESAGANLAANVAIEARDRDATRPLHQLLVYPIAGNDLETASYIENANAVPLGKADMQWFFDHVLETPDQADDPRINLVDRDDLQDLPPATVVTAEIDPLRSEGQAYAEALEAAGVTVNALDFEGVTHEFFGMGKVVDTAKEALDAANADLKSALAAAQ